MAADELIQPLGTPAPVEITPTEPQAETPPAPDLPDDLLRLPSMGPLLSGSPAALSLKIKDMEKTEDGKLIAKNFKALQDAGIFAYRALDKTTGILGNSLYITPEAIKQADIAGQLASIAPDWNMVGQEAARNPSINPVLTAQTPAGPPTVPAPPVPQMSAGTLPAPPPASTQTRLAGARAKNLQPGSPTSGPAPGRGRLLAGLLKPAI